MAATASITRRGAPETGNGSEVSAQLSRRALLGAAIVAPAFALPAAAMATTTEWNGALARYNAARARSDWYENAIAGPAGEELRRRAPVPASTFQITARNGQVATYRFEPEAPDAWDDAIGPLREAGMLLKQEWAEYRERRDGAVRDLGWDAIAARSDALNEAAIAAMDRAFETPALNGASLAQKVLLAFDEGRECDWALEHILADARRLGGQ